MLGKRQKVAACSGRLQLIMPAAGACSAFMETQAACSTALDQQFDQSINLISSSSISCKPIKPRLQVIGFQPAASSSHGGSTNAAAAAAAAARSPRSVLDAEALSGGSTSTTGDHHHNHHYHHHHEQDHQSHTSGQKPSSCKSPRSALGSLLMSSDTSTSCCTKKAAIIAADNNHHPGNHDNDHDNHCSSSHNSDRAAKVISEDVGLKIVLRSSHASPNPAPDNHARVQSSNHGDNQIPKQHGRDLTNMGRQTRFSGASAKSSSTPRSTHSIFSTSPAMAASSRSSTSGLDFLQACFLCKRSLTGPGKDIYMYRGDRAFCSAECRYHQILLDESQEDSTPTRRSSSSSSSSSRRGTTTTTRAVQFNQAAATIAAGA